MKPHYKIALFASAALIAGMPSGSLAKAAAPTANELAMEARLKELEAAVVELRAELSATHAQTKSVTQTIDATNARVGQENVRVAQLEAKAAQAVKPVPDGFMVKGTNVKLYGFIKANFSATHYDSGIVQQNPAAPSLIKDFYLPQQIPVGGGRSSNDFSAEAKQTRLGLTTETAVGKHVLKGLVEFDFQTSQGTQGSQRTTNGYNLALRRGYVQFDNLLVGQEWSNFQYVAALPESTDFVGPTEGTVFVRQPQVRYTQPLGNQLSLSVSAENAATASITPTSAALVENDADKIPDFTARLAYSSKFGELSLAGLVRQLSYDNGLAGTANLNATATGWGVSVAGKINLPFLTNSDLRFMATKGSGIGRYVGINYAPDVLQLSTPAAALQTADVFGGFAALKLGWTPQFRSTFVVSYQKDDYPALTPLTANAKSTSFSGNIFYSPVKNLDLGLEYRHGRRELLNATAGQIDRIEFATKYNF